MYLIWIFSFATVLLAINFDLSVDVGVSRRKFEGPLLPVQPGYPWQCSEITNFGARKQAGRQPLFLLPGVQAEQIAISSWSLMEKQCCLPACCWRSGPQAAFTWSAVRFPSKEEQTYQSHLSANSFSVLSSYILSKPLQECFGDI